MPGELKVSLGQHSERGRKEVNQDFFGAYIPTEPQLSSKGLAVAIADGISTSSVSHIASEAAVTTFLEDYFCTSAAWSVKKAAERVLLAINSWLHSQTQQSQYRYEKDLGYVCTFSAVVLKSTTAHLLHVGDTRIFRVQGGALEQLTDDHRFWMSRERSYLSRALGVQPQLEVDYRSLPIAAGETFVLATDGVYEFASPTVIVEAIRTHGDDLDAAARAIVAAAHENGSDDNLTVQIVRVDSVPIQDVEEIKRQLTRLPFPPPLGARSEIDGYRIIREIHSSSRSHVYLALDADMQTPVVLKTPSIDRREDPAYLDRFLMEDWIAQRINSAHVLKAAAQTRPRNHLYVVTEYIDGQTLAQWMIDNPRPPVETVRAIVEQIAKGLLAFHRLEMLHQDLRPENVMIDRTGTVKIIDFGSTLVAGVMEIDTPLARGELLGTAQYTAPEYFLGEPGTPRSDLFSLGVIVYQMLSGRLPYGTEVAKARTRAAQAKLIYRSVLEDDREIPAWIDEVLRKATHHDPLKRYEELSEFMYDLRHPSAAYLKRARPPLLERNPVAFWKGLSFVLIAAVLWLLFQGA